MQKLVALLCFVAVCCANPATVWAGGFIRDAEIERFLYDILTPLEKAAGMPEGSVKITIIADPSINAFVTGGTRIYMHTGTLSGFDTTSEVRAVLAHELGHITSHHITRRQQEMREAALPLAIASALGIATAAAGGGAAGIGVAIGASSAVERSILAHSRGDEAAADQAAISYMETAGYSPAGLLTSLQKLKRDEIYFASIADPYVLTHPLSAERVTLVANRVEKSPHKSKTDAKSMKRRLARIKAKLRGFLGNPDLIIRRQQVTTDGPFATEAQTITESIAYHLATQSDKAHKKIDALLSKWPKDPYYWELKGQFYLESGEAKKATKAFEKALRYAPDEPQFEVALASAILAMGGKQNALKAAQLIESAHFAHSDDPYFLANLARAYAQAGNEPMAAFSEARQQALIGNYDEAARYAQIAYDQLPDGAAKKRALDIIHRASEISAKEN